MEASNLEVNAEKIRLKYEVAAMLEVNENAFKKVSENQLLVQQICDKKTMLADAIEEYMLTWCNGDHTTENDLFADHIDDLSQIVEELEKNLTRLGEIVKGLIVKMEADVETLKSSLDIITRSTRKEDFRNLKWAPTVRDLKIKALVEEWNRTCSKTPSQDLLHFCQVLLQPVNKQEMEIQD